MLPSSSRKAPKTSNALAPANKVELARLSNQKPRTRVTGLSQRQTAIMHGISRSALQRAIKKGKPATKLGRSTFLDDSEEQKLVSMVNRVTGAGVGVTMSELLAAVDELILKRQQQGKSDPFKGKSPGRKWCTGFLKRHQLARRKPTPLSKQRKEAAANQENLRNWVKMKYEPALQMTCIQEGTGSRAVQETYAHHPERIVNMDETGFQRQHTLDKVIGPKGAKHIFTPATENGKLSMTVAAWGTATGRVLAPCYVYAGKYLTQHSLAHVQHYTDSAICAKKQSHMMDGSLLAKLLQHMASIFPGGVSKKKRVLLLLDGHRSRLSDETRTTAAQLGFDILLMPANCTHFMQPWDQLFGSVKAMYNRLFQWASSEHGYNPARSEIIGMVDSAIFLSVGFSTAPLSRAFEKTGLWPLNVDRLLFQARQSVSTRKRSEADESGLAPLPPWTRRDTTNQELKAIVQRVKQAQPDMPWLLVDQFTTKAAIDAHIRQQEQQAKHRGGAARTAGSKRGRSKQDRG